MIADRFQMEDLIGHGAMSEVYRGLDTLTETTVAIKVLKKEVAISNPVLLERFCLEGEALRRLNHPNITKMVAAVEEAGQPYIVMEYISGGTLREKLRLEGPLSIPLVLRIGLEMADALARAHYLQIVHRDIKPSNIMLDAEGTPRLTDFGIARVANRDPITETGMVLGTYAYLSPEACYGEEVDGRSDLWALGVVLYEMLAGQPPFQGDSIGALVTAILNQPVPDIKALRPETPDKLVQLILQMLAKPLEQRIPSARLVGAQLEVLLESLDEEGGLLYSAAARPIDLLEEPRHRVDSPAVTGFEQLPQYATPFLGRAREMLEIGALLADPDIRLVTLTGPGGIGKTRLAIEVARIYAREYRHGLRFVSLERVSSAEMVVVALAEALEFDFYLQGDPREQVLDFLREKHMLIVLDNFEHLLDAVSLVREVLDHAPRVKILVTSRERLNLQAERLYEVGGMDVPGEDATAIEEYTAIRLFIEHAHRANPDFTLSEADKTSIVQICRRLEGTPLSIELAASWMRMLPPAVLLREIDQNLDILVTTVRDVPERHRSLRAVFDYSYSLLSDEERRTFGGLAIFRGSFSREAAQAVTQTTPVILSGLVDKSLLRRTREERYEILPTLRQFASEMLGSDTGWQMTVREGMSDFYASFLQERQAALESDGQKEALDEIAHEIESIRRAWEWSGKLAHAQDFERGLESLFIFDEMRNQFQAGYQTFGQAIASLQHLEPCAVLGRLRARQGVFATHLGRYEEARLLLEEGLSTARRENLPAETGFCLNELGNLAYMQGRLDEAGTLVTECEAVVRSIGAKRLLAAALTLQGLLAHLHGDYRKAQRLHEESAALCRQTGERRALATSVRHLGITAYGLGEYAQAKRLYRQSLELDREVGNRHGVALALNGLGLVAYEQGKYQAAQDYYEDSLAIKREIGDWRGAAFSLNNLGLVAYHMADYRTARALLDESLRISRDLGERRAEGNILNNLGDVAYALHHYDEARMLYEESIAVKEEIGDRSGLAHTFNSLGRVAFDIEDFDEARRLFSESQAICREIGHQPGMADSMAGLGHLHLALGDTAQARQAYAEALEIASRIQAVPLMLDLMTAAARLAYTEGELEWSAELLGLPLEHEAANARTLERAHILIPFLKTELSEEVYLRCLKRGQGLTLPEAAIVTLQWL